MPKNPIKKDAIPNIIITNIIFSVFSDSFASIEFAIHKPIAKNVNAPKKAINDKICSIITICVNTRYFLYRCL